MTRDIQGRGSLSGEVANALSELAARKAVFSVDEFASAIGRPKDKVWRVLHALAQGRWVVRLQRGTYATVPLEAGPEGAWSEDALVIGCHLARPSSIAYWSACAYWDWTEQTPRTVFVQSSMRKADTTQVVFGVRYRFVQIRSRKMFGLLPRSTGRGDFTVTDREKTLIDAFDHPELCGGIQSIGAMLPVATPSLDWERVDAYLDRLSSGAVYKRLGFLVDTLAPELEVPDLLRRLERWRARLTRGYAALDPGGLPGGRFDSKWRLRLNTAVPGPSRGQAL